MGPTFILHDPKITISINHKKTPRPYFLKTSSLYLQCTVLHVDTQALHPHKTGEHKMNERNHGELTLVLVSVFTAELGGWLQGSAPIHRAGVPVELTCDGWGGGQTVEASSSAKWENNTTEGRSCHENVATKLEPHYFLFPLSCNKVAQTMTYIP